MNDRKICENFNNDDVFDEYSVGHQEGTNKGDSTRVSISNGKEQGSVLLPQTAAVCCTLCTSNISSKLSYFIFWFAIFS